MKNLAEGELVPLVLGWKQFAKRSKTWKILIYSWLIQLIKFNRLPWIASTWISSNFTVHLLWTKGSERDFERFWTSDAKKKLYITSKYSPIQAMLCSLMGFLNALFLPLSFGEKFSNNNLHFSYNLMINILDVLLNYL